MSAAPNNFLPALADGTQPAGRRTPQTNQDSLYKYISWEDPARTMGSYFAALGFLLAVHYLHITQLALKLSAIALGAMSLAEFAGRSFGPNNFLSRLRPREYKTVPESTLNATLKDIHDFIQYAVVQAQKVVYAQDLEATFGAFLAITSLYFLIQFMSPFGIAVLGLTTVYIIPLITSPRGKDIARDGMARAQELSNAAVDKGNALAQDSKAGVSNLSSRAQDTAGDLRRRAGNMVPGSMAPGGKQTSGDTRPEHVSDITSNVPHYSSEATQAKDISPRFPDTSKSSQGDIEHFNTQPSARVNTTGQSFNPSTGFSQDTGISQDIGNNLPSQSQPTASTFSHGTTDDLPAPSNTSDYSQEDMDEDMPSYAQHKRSINYSKFPHMANDTSGMRPDSDNLAQGGMQSSTDDSYYRLQDRQEQGSGYSSFVPRGQPNRGQLGSTTNTSAGQMPIGELLDEANRAGDKAPPLSAGGLNTMK
ncbi:hypothetical protein FSARC_10769 [Fusarium sarcochroum]|uniref:Reticulon domain-containing protein n=1 Tax=Fusarium sarcochroum TaxID=1208366 RepID=A0A8H4X244_9HYPO|nr:hypothetical protein FSARC_10769 [Fusarium sarcochroum]